MISEQQQQQKAFLQEQLRGTHMVSDLAKLLCQKNVRLLRDICSYLTGDQVLSITARALHDYKARDTIRTKGGLFIFYAKQLISRQDDMKYTDIFRKRKNIPIKQVVTKLINIKLYEGQNDFQVEGQFQ